MFCSLLSSWHLQLFIIYVALIDRLWLPPLDRPLRKLSFKCIKCLQWWKLYCVNTGTSWVEMNSSSGFWSGPEGQGSSDDILPPSLCCSCQMSPSLRVRSTRRRPINTASQLWSDSWTSSWKSSREQRIWFRYIPAVEPRYCLQRKLPRSEAAA